MKTHLLPNKLRIRATPRSGSNKAGHKGSSIVTAIDLASLQIACIGAAANSPVRQQKCSDSIIMSQKCQRPWQALASAELTDVCRGSRGTCYMRSFRLGSRTHGRRYFACQYHSDPSAVLDSTRTKSGLVLITAARKMSVTCHLPNCLPGMSSNERCTCCSSICLNACILLPGLLVFPEILACKYQ